MNKCRYNSCENPAEDGEKLCSYHKFKEQDEKAKRGEKIWNFMNKYGAIAASVIMAIIFKKKN